MKEDFRMKSLIWIAALVLGGAHAVAVAPAIDAELEAIGRHRALPGETLNELAKRAGIETNVFYEMNGPVCGWDGQAKLKAGEIVQMRNPLEFARIHPSAGTGDRYSLHEYEFRGVGARHSKAEVAKYEIDAEDHPDISCRWSIAWPEKGSGLDDAGLKTVRKAVIDGCFGMNFYEAQQWKAPETIEAVEAEFRREAHNLFGCVIETNETCHCCSRWNFIAESELTWPFGSKQGEEWYQRPVLCFKNSGYSNDGGNGCHSYVAAHVFSLPDGRELDERDYFREDAMGEVFALVISRLFRDNKLTVADTIEKDMSKIKYGPGDLCMNVSAKGMTWWVSAYDIFPGCFGVTTVTIPWQDLLKYLKDPSSK